jgi:site-specific recombinase XerD
MKAKTRSLSFSEAIDSFILYLAVEKGLSANYQLSNRQSLQKLATWCAAGGLPDPRAWRNDVPESLLRLHQLLIHHFECFGADADLPPEWVVHGG